MKLIPIEEGHYIIVDDSEIKEGDIVLWLGKKIWDGFRKSTNGHYLQKGSSQFRPIREFKKITHSTEPLLYDEDGSYYPMNVTAISVEEVEEAIYGYDVEKMADSYSKQFNGDYADNHTENIANAGFIEGFKAHQQLSKDKLFTVEDMKKCAKAMCAFECGYDDILFDSFIESLSPTKWEVEFDNDGKLKLK